MEPKCLLSHVKLTNSIIKIKLLWVREEVEQELPVLLEWVRILLEAGEENWMWVCSMPGSSQFENLLQHSTISLDSFRFFGLDRSVR